jgi:hypothetical protein
MHIASIFKTNKLLTRESATDLFKLIALKQASKIYVDFENINFISRSFADQFHKEKLSLLEATGKQVHLTNHNNDVFAMFNVVSKTQTQHRNIPLSNVVIYEFEQRKIIKEFFFSF